MRNLAKTAICLLCAAWPLAGWPYWIFDLELGALHDTNLPRAQLPADIKGGNALTGSFSVGQFYSLDGQSSITATADARVARYDGYSGLDLNALGATLTFKHKFGVGLTVPWASVSLAAAREEYGTAIRDSDRYTLTLEAGKRLTERLEGSLGISGESRNARTSQPLVPGYGGDPFDLSGQTFFVRGSYALAERADLAFGYSVRSGDVVSSTRRNFQIFRASSAIAPDPAFGPDYFAYRLDGVTRTPWVGVGWSLSEYSSLRVVYTRELTYGASGLNYYGTLINASFLHRF